MDIFRRLIFVVMLLSGMGASGVSRADTVDTILNILYTAGVVDGAVVQAKPLIQCLVGGSSVTSCSQQYAGQQAGDFVAGDPKIKLVVDIILSANSGNWINVLELTGTDLLVQMACSAGMPGGGPVKDFVCGGVFSQVASLAKPVVREVLVSVRDKEWLRLITLLGPDLACAIIPSSVPLKDQVCGPLGAILAAATQLVGDAAGALKDLANSAYEAVDGQSPHMSYDEFYKRFLMHSIHTRVVERLVYGRSGLGLNPDQWSHCVKYFDSHEQAHDTAEKTCTDLGNRLHRESELVAKAIEPAPEAYYAAHLKNSAFLRDLAAEKFHSNMINDHKSYIFSVAPADYRYGSILPSPLKNDLKQPYLDCMTELISRFPLPNSVERLPNAWNWVCWNAVGRSFANDLQLERLRLAITVIANMKKLSCEPKAPGAGTGLVFQCSSLGGYQSCQQTFDGYRYKHCRTSQLVVDAALGSKLVGMLGKRCTFLATSKEGYNDPRVVCTRPWKHAECEQLLAQEKQSPMDSMVSTSPLYCKYYETSEFKQAREKAEAILAALNAPPTTEVASAEGASSSGQLQLAIKPTAKLAMRAKRLVDNIKNCSAGWDPLVLRCLNPSVLSSLATSMPGITLFQCSSDPRKDGADVPCYDGAEAPSVPVSGQSINIQKAKSARDVTLASHADQVAKETFILAGQLVHWGTSVTLDAGQLLHNGLGACLAEAEYVVENRGAAMSPAASRDQWTVAGRSPDVMGSVGRIPPSDTRQQTVTLALYPGVNQVTLTLDPENKIQEEDEGNNVNHITVQLDGDCRAGSGRGSLGRQSGAGALRVGDAPPVMSTGVAPVAGQPSLKGLSGIGAGIGSRSPDLVFGGMPRIGGMPGAWNGAVMVNSNSQATKAGDVCHIPLDYQVMNAGQQAAGGFRAVVRNTLLTGTGWTQAVPMLAAGASMMMTVTISLRPGQNRLEFMLDDLGQVAESDESNNRASLTVSLIGDCLAIAPVPRSIAPTTAPSFMKVPNLIKR